MTSLTVFNSIKDVDTRKRQDFKSFDELEGLLYRLADLPAYKPAKGEFTRKASPLISPAIYHDGETRKNVNVVAWAGWAALDIDEYDRPYEEIMNLFGDAYFICYSTASSTKAHPKFRLVFPLTRYVEKDEIKGFWHALNAEYLGIGDAQTKDLSRMFYVPGQYPNAHNFIFTRKGPILDPDVVMEKHPFLIKESEHFFDRLPDELQKEFIEHQKSKLTNTHITWTSYHDCPFVNQRLVSEYKALPSGWYHMMYRIAVSIAGNAHRQSYPITASQIEFLCRQIDADTGGWYKDRPLHVEADRALEFVYRNSFE